LNRNLLARTAAHMTDPPRRFTPTYDYMKQPKGLYIRDANGQALVRRDVTLKKARQALLHIQ
jgi:hypothetical protein